MANTLFLQLEGALQSWGERAHWSVRDSAPEPTKSGVVGLLACALGLVVDEDLRILSQKVRIGVRCDRPGARLTDYHTVAGGIMSGEGKVKRNSVSGRVDTVVSFRDYLCDASFLVAVQAADAALIADLGEAVQHPHWPLYLGRKSCPPSRPPFEGVGDYATLRAALEGWPTQADEAGTRLVRAVLEADDGRGTRRRDEIISRARRTYGPRYTYDVSLRVASQAEEVQDVPGTVAPE